MGRDALMEDQLDMFGSETFYNEDQVLKLCLDCQRKLPENCFSFKGSFRKDGTSRRRNSCKECKKHQRQTIRYLKRVTPLPDNKYKCPICLSPKANKWVMDHNHNTNKFRGWLCNNCNSAIGWLRDDINKIRRAVSYLEKDEESC